VTCALNSNDGLDSVQQSIDETSEQNQAKQDTLEMEKQKSDDLEKTMQELEKKLDALRE
jgi:hypothetical protein